MFTSRDFDLIGVERGLREWILVTRIIRQRDFDSVHAESALPPESDDTQAGRVVFDIHPAESDSRRRDLFHEFGKLAIVGFTSHLAEPDVLRGVNDDFVVRP